MMGDLAQLDLHTKGGELRLKALLQDWVDYHKTVYPNRPLALAVWFGKSPDGDEQSILELYDGPPIRQDIRESGPFPIGLEPGSEGPPFVKIWATSVPYFTNQLVSNRASLERYFVNFEVLHSDKSALADSVLQAFKIVTEPPGLLKGWYISPRQLADTEADRLSIASLEKAKPSVGLVKTQESGDFEHCKGLVHVEVDQTWIPLSPEALPSYNFYADVQGQQPGQFIFQGGSHYRILKFEVKTCPDYSALVLEKLPHDRYPEVYLRAVHPSEPPATELRS